MRDSRITLFNHRILISLLVFFFSLGLVIFVLVQRSVTSFKFDEIEKNMTWMGNSVNYFCSSGYDQLARVGKIKNTVEVLLKQAETLEMIEDFARNNEFSIIVYDLSEKVPLPILSSFMGAEELIDPLKLAPNMMKELQINSQQYNSLAIEFDSWAWRIILLKDSSSYDTLLSRLNIFYLAIGLLTSMLILVFLLFFKQQSRSEKALRESELELKYTLDSLAEGVIAIDAQGHVTQINPAAISITGRNPNENILGRHASEIIPLIYLEDQTALLPTTFEDGGSPPLTSNEASEFTLATHNGTQKLVQVRLARSSTQSSGREDKSLVLSIHDITQHKAVERKLHQAQKMEAIGLMAGGVAHDLNNILSGLVSYPELLLLQLPEKSELRQPIQAIHQSGRRAAAVVADLLTVARGVASTRETSNLSTLLEEYIESPEFFKLEHLYPEVTFAIHSAENLPNISCSTVHVKKCIMNLLLNSAEAISGSGSCIVSTSNSQISGTEAERLQIEPGNYALLTVQDNGPGISKDNIGHIFEPFYTKKKMGMSGTGLGLAIVWNTMLDHKGMVTVESKDKQTLFSLYFPTSHDKKLAVRETLPLENLQGNNETILIVDDDPQQRDIATQVLTSFSYIVGSVNSGEDAINYLEERGVDLLLLDMIMDPGMTGYETYRKIIKIHPHQKALIASGYSESDDVKKTLRLGAGGFLKKPYSMDQLGKAVQDELRR